MFVCTCVCSKTTPPPAKGGFPGNVGNHIATPLRSGTTPTSRTASTTDKTLISLGGQHVAQKAGMSLEEP